VAAALIAVCVVVFSSGIAYQATAGETDTAAAGILGVKPGMTFAKVRSALRNKGCRAKVSGFYRNIKRENIGVWKMNANCEGGDLRVHFNSPDLGNGVQNIFFTMRKFPRGVSSGQLLDKARDKHGRPEWCRNVFGETLCFWGNETKFLYARSRSRSFGLVYVDKEAEAFFASTTLGQKTKSLAVRTE